MRCVMDIHAHLLRLPTLSSKASPQVPPLLSEPSSALSSGWSTPLDEPSGPDTRSQQRSITLLDDTGVWLAHLPKSLSESEVPLSQFPPPPPQHCFFECFEPVSGVYVIPVKTRFAS